MVCGTRGNRARGICFLEPKPLRQRERERFYFYCFVWESERERECVYCFVFGCEVWANLEKLNESIYKGEEWSICNLAVVLRGVLYVKFVISVAARWFSERNQRWERGMGWSGIVS